VQSRASRSIRGCLCAGLALVLAAPVSAGTTQSAFDGLVDRLRAVHAYEFDVDATEHAGSVTKAATMHVAVNVDDHSEQLVILAGAHHGSVVSWSGGPDESVKLPGMMSVIPIHGALRDSKFLSLRGNDIRVAELQTILDCYAAHRDSMVEAPGPMLDGEATVSISISSKDGVMCDGNDWQQERAVTRDEVLVSRATGLPKRRARYEGAILVEEWDLRDFTTHGGPELRPADGTKQASTR
jgi:hypothetical protein